jgi:hypothetical protein
MDPQDATRFDCPDTRCAVLDNNQSKYVDEHGHLRYQVCDCVVFPGPHWR